MAGIPALQTFRFFVELLLWALFVQNWVPVQMTFEGRNWDILVGFTAGFVGYFCLVERRWSVKVAFWWNIAGLLLVLNIAAVAILFAPTPFRVFMNEPANTIVTYFAIVWLPAVLFHWPLRSIFSPSASLVQTTVVKNGQYPSSSLKK